jgi:cytochrome c
MSTTTRRLAGAALAAAIAGASSAALGADDARFGFGTAASQQELARFTSVLPDGRGLPAGSGSVEQGRALYEQRCAACHGADLQGGIGDRLIGGRGTLPGNSPQRSPIKTVESYWPYATTLYDYIKRAMPFDAPDSLTPDQVYAVSAYILARAKIVPADAVLDASSLAKVRMPNRDGFVPDPRPQPFPPPKEAARSVR